MTLTGGPSKFHPPNANEETRLDESHRKDVEYVTQKPLLSPKPGLFPIIPSHGMGSGHFCPAEDHTEDCRFLN